MDPFVLPIAGLAFFVLVLAVVVAGRSAARASF
jgi:hypothetical protein